jgi:hypothetical protein
MEKRGQVMTWAPSRQFHVRRYPKSFVVAAQWLCLAQRTTFPRPFQQNRRNIYARQRISFSGVHLAMERRRIPPKKM